MHTMREQVEQIRGRLCAYNERAGGTDQRGTMCIQYESRRNRSEGDYVHTMRGQVEQIRGGLCTYNERAGGTDQRGTMYIQ